MLAPLAFSLSGWWVMLVNPGIHVSTAEVYTNTRMAPAKTDLAESATRHSPREWNSRLVNVMEEYVLSAYPEVAETKRLIKEAGADYCAMSGSGSSVYGLFRNKPTLPALPSGNRSWVLPL